MTLCFLLWLMTGRFMLWVMNVSTNKVHKETKLKSNAHGTLTNVCGNGVEHGLTGMSARVQCQWLKRTGAKMVATRNDRT